MPADKVVIVRPLMRGQHFEGVAFCASLAIDWLPHLILRIDRLTCALQAGQGTTTSKPSGKAFDHRRSRCLSSTQPVSRQRLQIGVTSSASVDRDRIVRAMCSSRPRQPNQRNHAVPGIALGARRVKHKSTLRLALRPVPWRPGRHSLTSIGQVSRHSAA